MGCRSYSQVAVFLTASLNAPSVVRSRFVELGRCTADNRTCVSVDVCPSLHVVLDELVTWPGCHSAFARWQLRKGSSRPPCMVPVIWQPKRLEGYGFDSQLDLTKDCKNGSLGLPAWLSVAKVGNRGFDHPTISGACTAAAHCSVRA